MTRPSKEIKTWILNNGNRAMSYEMRQPMERPWVIILVGLFFVALVLTEYFVNRTIYSLLPICFLFFFLFVYWALYPCRYNKQVELEWMNRYIDLQREIKKYDKGIHEIKRKFYQETRGTYGIIKATYMLILLSNGKVLEYELKYHHPSSKKEAFHELTINPVECTNPKRRNKIVRRTIGAWFSEQKISERTKMSILIIFMFIIAILSLLVIELISKNFSLWTVFSLGGYVIIFFLYNRFLSNRNSRVTKKIGTIIKVPFLIFLLWINLLYPAMVVIISFIMLASYSFGLPFLLLNIINWIFKLQLNNQTILFISLVVCFLICIHCPKFVQILIKKLSPLKNWGNHNYEAIQEDLALYILGRNNVNFLFYLAYFIYLAISGFMRLQYAKPLVSDSFDVTVLKAFLVFLAYSNMISKSKDVDVDAKQLFTKMIELIITHDK